MDRIAFSAILLLALGLWIHPYLTGSNALEPVPTLARLTPPASAAPPTTAPAPLPKIDPSKLAAVHGKAGFWRLGKTASGVWWFIGPDNQPQFMNTVTSVQPWQLGRDKDGINYVSRDYQGATFGDDQKLDDWAVKTIARLKEMGFHGIGAWSNRVFQNFDMPVSRDLNVWQWMKPDQKRFYSTGWAPMAEQAISTQCGPLKDNHAILGYFIDNELDWGDGASGPDFYFSNLSPEDPNRREVVKVMQATWTKLDDFNRDWQVQIKDWSELNSWSELPKDRPAAYSRLFSAWLSHLSEDYFKLTCGLIHKYDPNHLVLGVRFRGYAPTEVVRASKNYTDAQSINYYVSDAKLDAEMFKMMNEESGQPIIITEYSFHALDGSSGDRDTVGFAGQVLDQQARADGYRLFTSRAARVPYIVGLDWFQWCDEPPSGRASDGEDVNFGIVDVDDRPYPILADAIKQTAPFLDGEHAGSVTDSQVDVWRESFAQKPVMNVPMLTSPISLNGELSDWPLANKLPAMRHAQTVGLERSQLPVPNVYLGWTEQGLYLGFEVFDNDINGAPADGWWWTRDFMEFWISTRPVAADQNGYDIYSHQFFFVPNSWPGPDGLLGTVGQWHRPGDALKDNKVPDSDIRSAVRVLPDRYVVEMFIPARALNGFDPVHQNMAFNCHVRNFQHATDYFWSAPKEAMTQLRPNTWGTLNMVGSGSKDIAQQLTGTPLSPTLH